VIKIACFSVSFRIVSLKFLGFS